VFAIINDEQLLRRCRTAGGSHCEDVEKREENISLALFYTMLYRKGDFRFTLFFSRLPKACKLFLLLLVFLKSFL
jgi:hypothetical protein